MLVTMSSQNTIIFLGVYLFLAKRLSNFLVPLLEPWQPILPVNRKKKCMLARHTKHMSFLIQVWLSIENSQSESWQIVQCGFWQQFSGIQIHHVLRGFSKRNRNEWLQNWVDNMHNLLITSEKKVKKDIIWRHLILWYHIDSWKVRGSCVFSGLNIWKSYIGALYFF